MTRGGVEALPHPSRGRVEYRDTVVSKLILRVGGTSKVYYVYVRAKKGRPEEKIRLGTSDDLSPGEARIRARVVLASKEPAEPPHQSTTPLLHPDDEFLTTKEAAALMRMSPAWFEKCRWQGIGPPYLKCGRSVRYVRRQLLEWWSLGC